MKAVVVVFVLVSVLFWIATSDAPSSTGDMANSEVMGEAEDSDGERRNLGLIHSEVSAEQVLQESFPPDPEFATSLYRSLRQFFVVDDDGQSLSGIDVQVWQPDNQALAPGRHKVFEPAPGEEPIQAFVSDDRGMIELINVPVGSWYLLATGKNLAGGKRIVIPESGSKKETRSSEFFRQPIYKQIRLSSYRDFHIRVVDISGAPMDHALVVIIDPDQEKLPGMHLSFFDAERLRQGITGEDGSFILRVAANQEDKLFYARRLRLLCFRFGGEPLDVTVDLDATSHEFKLVLPPTLRLHLQVKDHGQAIEETARVVWVAGDRAPTLRRSRRMHRSAPLTKNIWSYVGKWKVRIPPQGIILRAFAPGANIAVSTKVPNHEDATEVITLPKSNEHHAVLQAGKRKARVVLDIVDENGAIADRRFLRFESYGSSAEPRVVTFWHDKALGRLVAWVDAETAGEIRIQHRDAPWRRESADFPILKRLPFTAVAPGETHDLGTLTIPKPPLIVSGRCVDSQGEAVKGVGIVASAKVPKFTTQSSEYAESEADGSFCLRGLLRGVGQFRLGTTGEFRAVEQELSLGATDVVVVVSKTASISGRVRPFEPNFKGKIDVEYFAEHLKYPRKAHLSKSGDFYINRLDPGTYSFEVLVNGRLDRKVEDVVLAPGQDACPPQLKSLKVGADFRQALVTVLDENGSPVSGVSLRLGGVEENRRRGLFSQKSLSTDSAGEARFLVQRDAAFVLRVSPNRTRGVKIAFARQEIANPVFPLRVILHPRAQISIEFSQALPKNSAAGWSVGFSQEYDEKTIARMEKARKSLAESGSPSRSPLRTRRFRGQKVLPMGEVQVLLELDRPKPGTWDIVLRMPRERDEDMYVVIGSIRSPVTQDTEIKITLTQAMREALAHTK